MSTDFSTNKVIIIVGPTGVGKTALSIQLAQRIDGEVISADSRYLYRGMDIGTAKPGREELKSVPHHLINVADPGETWSLAVFVEKSLVLIQEIQARKRVPIVVGGTGQYLRAIKEGWKIPEIPPSPEIRQCLEELAKEIGSGELHRRLAILDSVAAEFIDPTNTRRTIRALEVIFLTGKRFSELRRREGPAFDYYIIGLTLDREKLYARVDERIEHMIDKGLIEEVRNLLKNGYTEETPSMSAIGYHEAMKVINREISIESAVESMRKRTRILIRRQANWFKEGDKNIHWYDTEENPIEMILEDLRKGTSLV